MNKLSNSAIIERGKFSFQELWAACRYINPRKIVLQALKSTGEENSTGQYNTFHSVDTGFRDKTQLKWQLNRILWGDVDAVVNNPDVTNIICHTCRAQWNTLWARSSKDTGWLPWHNDVEGWLSFCNGWDLTQHRFDLSSYWARSQQSGHHCWCRPSFRMEYYLHQSTSVKLLS